MIQVVWHFSKQIINHCFRKIKVRSNQNSEITLSHAYFLYLFFFNVRRKIGVKWQFVNTGLYLFLYLTWAEKYSESTFKKKIDTVKNHNPP